MPRHGYLFLERAIFPLRDSRQGRRGAGIEIINFNFGFREFNGVDGFEGVVLYELSRPSIRETNLFD